jgi:hypothetical protein
MVRGKIQSGPPPFSKPRSFLYVQITCQVWSRNSVVGIATGYGLDDRGVGVRVPVGSRIFSSPRRPHRLLGQPNLLSNGYRSLFPQGFSKLWRYNYCPNFTTIPFGSRKFRLIFGWSAKENPRSKWYVVPKRLGTPGLEKVHRENECVQIKTENLMHEEMQVLRSPLQRRDTSDRITFQLRQVGNNCRGVLCWKKGQKSE